MDFRESFFSVVLPNGLLHFVRFNEIIGFGAQTDGDTNVIELLHGRDIQTTESTSSIAMRIFHFVKTEGENMQINITQTVSSEM